MSEPRYWWLDVPAAEDQSDAPKPAQTGPRYWWLDVPEAPAEEQLNASRKPEATAKPGMLEAIGRGGVQGATLGAGDEIYAAGSGAMAKARGQDFEPEYERQLAETQASNRAAKEAHPWAYGISEAVGAVPGLIYGGSTALGAKALGLVGKSFLQRSGMSALSGAGIGAAQGAATADIGESRSDGFIRGGAGGAVVGAASPAIGAAVGEGVGAITNAIRTRAANPGGVGNAAGGLLEQDARAAGGVNAIRDRLAELGPEARLLDASPSFQGRAQGLAIQPETREMISAPLAARNQGTNSRLASDLDSAIGPAPRPSQIEAGIREGQGALGDDYAHVFQGARAVDTSALANRLDTMAVDMRGPAASAIGKVRGYLDIPGNRGQLDPNPSALLQTRHAIDGMLDGEVNSKVIGALTTARREVDSILGEAAPGIKAVDARYAELARQSEGLQRGSQVFDGGKNAIRPADYADEFSRSALPQGEMVGPSAVPVRMREGARAEIDRVVGTNANDLNELRKLVKGDGDWNLTKLIRTFGSREGAQVYHAIDRETAFREAYQNIVQGSQTAMRTGAAEGTKVRGQGPTTAAGIPAIAGAIGGPGAAAAAIGSQGVRMGAGQVMKASDLTRNRQVAESLMMRAGPELDSVLDGVAARIMASERSGMTKAQARELAQIVVLTQGNNAGEGLQRLPGLGGLGGLGGMPVR